MTFSTEDCHMKSLVKKLALCTFICLLAPVTASAVPLDPEFWFQFIHCSNSMGYSPDHSAGSNPAYESGLHDDEVINQCHGVPGQDGSCPSSTSDFSVFCVVVFQENRCFAEAKCPNGSRISCGGPGETAFSGLRRFAAGGHHEFRKYVLCRKGGQVTRSLLCPPEG